ncbi:MAG: molybdenum metabolism regulator, partial [Microcystaceae cyanobacterium]
MYEFEQGRQLWQQPTIGKVLWGCQTEEWLYVATSGKQVQCFSKTGQFINRYLCDASVYACAVDTAQNLIFASASSGFIYGFQRSGKRLWKASTGCGSALSLQLAGSGKNQLYLATNQGILACMEVSDR